MEQALIPAGEQNLEQARPIEVITAEIWLFKQQAGAAILEIGRRLNEAKAQLDHGEWEPWLKEKVEFSEATARRFMRLAREYENQSLVTDLGTSKALILLALPASEREEFIEETHVVDGEEKTVFEMSKRELETAIRERDEARARIIELESDAVRMDEERAALENRCTAADMQIAELEERLEETSSQKVIAEIVVDEDALKKAADEAAQKTKAEFETKVRSAEQSAKKAERERAEAEQKLQKLQKQQSERDSTWEREKQALEERLSSANKQLATAASSEISVFKLHFEQVQEGIDKMSNIVVQLEESGQTNDAAKLKNALRALLNAALDVIE